MTRFPTAWHPEEVTGTTETLLMEPTKVLLGVNIRFVFVVPQLIVSVWSPFWLAAVPLVPPRLAVTVVPVVHPETV
jgi:hypothetical protein